MVGPFSRRVALPAGLVVLLMVAGGVLVAQAEEYEGPGHRGMVPIGDGGVVASHAPDLGEGLMLVPLEGIPEKACRVVLDENESYARTLLVWSPGNETAYVAAEAGERDAPFRVVSHWERDMNDDCTVEVTPDGKVWHEPRGRPFIEMMWQERHVHYNPEPGTWFPVEAVLENNGTLEETVNVSVQYLQEEWQVRNSTGSVDRTVAPEGTLRFGFELYLPENERTGTKLILFDAVGTESGWSGRATIALHVKGSDQALSTGSDDHEEDGEDEGTDPHNVQDLPSQKVGPSGQVPMVPVLPVAILVLAGLAVARARSRL